MQILLVVVFFLMLLPSLVAVAIASRSLPLMLWNYGWFMVLAQVGTLAFKSSAGAYPALIFALLYTNRAMRNRRPQPGLDIRFFKGSMSQQAPTPHFNKEEGVIEGEFRREPSDPKLS